MSIITAQRALELIYAAKWADGEALRVFWLQVTGSRDDMAKAMNKSLGKEGVICLVVRDSCFTVPNRIQSDLHELINASRSELEKLKIARPERLTIVILLKESFGKAQVGSPITLPDWFPVRPGLDSHIFLTDLVGLQSGALLSGPEAKVERVAELVLELESALVDALERLSKTSLADAEALLRTLLDKSTVNVGDCILSYREHVSAVATPRGYRPNASATTKSLVSDALRLFLALNIDDLAKRAKIFAKHFAIDSRLLKPTYLGVTLRPRINLSLSGQNWFSVIVGLYQSYQLMNASAHAGDYGLYPAALIHYSSQDLQTFLEDAHDLLTSG